MVPASVSGRAPLAAKAACSTACWMGRACSATARPASVSSQPSEPRSNEADAHDLLQGISPPLRPGHRRVIDTSALSRRPPQTAGVGDRDQIPEGLVGAHRVDIHARQPCPPPRGADGTAAVCRRSAPTGCPLQQPRRAEPDSVCQICTRRLLTWAFARARICHPLMATADGGLPPPVRTDTPMTLSGTGLAQSHIPVEAGTIAPRHIGHWRMK